MLALVQTTKSSMALTDRYPAILDTEQSMGKSGMKLKFSSLEMR
jgi:hypothetical protein